MSKKKSKLVFSTRVDADLDQGNRPRKLNTSLPPQQQTIRVMLDRKRRKGKTVTVCNGFQLTSADLKKLEKELKQFCGAGGTSKGNEIEIQGDHRAKIIDKLLGLKYKAKQSGG